MDIFGPDKEQLLFGDKRDTERNLIYARYASGDPVSIIAADTGMTEEEVYAIMRSCPAENEKVKQRREQFTGLRTRRSLNLLDAYNLRMLEELIEGKLDLTSEIMKELTKLSKVLAHRVQLLDGKATNIIDQRNNEAMSLEAMKQKIAEAEAAGTGIDTGSIEGEGQ